MTTLKDSELDGLVTFAEELAAESRAMLDDAGAGRPEAQVKADRSFVTALDGAIEQRLRQQIEARFPGHGIIGEEFGASGAGAEFAWVIDPIDGTAAYIAGIPVYGTLIALMRNDEPLIGIIDQPATGDRWVGVAGRPTLHNGAPCRTRSCEALEEAILSTSNPDFYAPEERGALEALRSHTAWRIYGGSCLSYGLLAAGRIDLALDTRLKIHDIAPFRPIIEGAGGVVTDWHGRPLTMASGPQILAAGDKARHADALALVRRAVDRA